MPLGCERALKDNGGVLERAYEKATTAIAGFVKGVSFKALEVPPPVEDPAIKPSKKPEIHLEVTIPQRWTRELDKRIVETSQLIGAQTGTEILLNNKWRSQ